MKKARIFLKPAELVRALAVATNPVAGARLSAAIKRSLMFNLSTNYTN